MKIISVSPIAVTFPLSREPMSFCFVRVEAEDGSVGYGEACDSYGCSYAGILATAITDAFAPLLVNRMRLYTRRRLGDQWVAAQARSACEIALWDLAGQAAGLSVSALLGRV